MPATLRFPRAFVTTCAIGLAAALPIACAQGSSGYGLIGLGGDTVGSGGRESSGASSGEMSSSSTSTSSSSGHTSSSSGHTSTSTSSSTSSSSSSTSGTTSSGASSSCDNSDCMTCQTCAQGLPTCSADFNNCLNDFGCEDILFCWQCTCLPGDATCLESCIAADPGTSADLFNTWATCVVCSCQQTCAITSGC